MSATAIPTTVAFTLTLTLTFSVSPGARANPPCANLTPDRGSLGFQQRSGGDRCEGFFRSNVSSEALSIAYLRSGQLPNATEVEVSGAGPPREMYVRAFALPLGMSYRMDATISPKTPLRWPLVEVVGASKSLKVTDLGLYGWFGTAAHPTYAPVRAAVPGATPATNEEIVLGVRANVPLEVVLFNITNDARCRFGNTPWQQLRTGVSQGTVLTLPLPRDRPALCVSFRAKRADTDRIEPLTAPIYLH
jgi:hypothetical protein